MKIYLIIGKNVDLASYPFEKGAIKIGIDYGAILSIDNGIRLDYAVGDFDSCTSEEKEQILLRVPNVISLNSAKDDTDTKHAYSMFKDKKDVEFVLLGSIQGKRIEHFYANLELLMEDERIVMQDDNTFIFSKKHDFDVHKNEYKYFSFFPIGEETMISLKGFKYPLYEKTICKGDGLTISNELSSIMGTVSIHKGSLLCIFSKNDSRL